MKIFLDYCNTSELQNPTGGDFTICRCKLHAEVEHSVKGGVGCAARALGRFPPIWGANVEPGKHKFCAASEAQRRADAVLVADAFRVACGVSGEELEKLRASQDDYVGPPHEAREFGAQYCHMDSIQAGHRARVARVLGPDPLVVDLARVFCLVGRLKMKKLDLVQVLPGRFHVVKNARDNGQSEDAGRQFLMDLATVVLATGGQARVGLTVSEWLSREGFAFPAKANFDLGLVSHTGGTVRGSDERVRLRILALLGDRALKVVHVLEGMEKGFSIEKLNSDENCQQSDANLARLFAESSLADCVALGSSETLSAKVGGTAFEAVAGVVYLYCGQGELLRFARLLKLKI